jgi:hypothetical protein
MAGETVSDDAAREILIVGARALAHVDGLRSSLQLLIQSIAEGCDAGSAAIAVAGEGSRLEIVATFGLDEASTAGLAGAIRRPGHPIARTFTEPTPTFDVLPTAPGGPALRSHLPLMVTRGGKGTVLGVLALAHDRSIEEEMRPMLLAAADLAAVVIERERPG